MSGVLIFGATSSTGKLIARYLVEHPQRTSSPFTITLGGQSRDKLSELATSLGLGIDSNPIAVVDLSDYSAVESAVVQVKVVINAISPSNWKFGEHVVR